MKLPVVDRSRAGWWLLGAACLAALGLFVHTFVGTFVLGLFVYYAARPLFRRLREWTGTRTGAASLTVVALVLPGLLVLAYVSGVALREFAAVAGPELTAAVLDRLAVGSEASRLLREPLVALSGLGDVGRLGGLVRASLRPLGTLATGLLHLSLALALAFFLYNDGDRLRDWFDAEIGGRDTALDAYLRAVDRDLEAVYFGNLLTVLIVTGLSVLVYNGFNLLAPGGLSLPFPTLLAVSTGLATFVPLVVGKVVYVPATAYLALAALRSDAGLLWVPAAFAAVAFLLLDLLPQSVLRPYLSGRTLHSGLILFAYVLGTALFGWYGLFYGPLLAVVVVQFANVVLPELVRGDPVDPEGSDALAIGSAPPDPEAPETDREARRPADDPEATPGDQVGGAGDPDAVAGDEPGAGGTAGGGSPGG